jgi:hypothetical protein
MWQTDLKNPEMALSFKKSCTCINPIKKETKMIKTLPIIALIAALAACEPNADVTNPAIATDDAVQERKSTAPATGATSFTEQQARGHLVDKGYLNPTGLTLLDDGTWRGGATLNGQAVSVTVDYQGNVTTN